MSYPTMPADLVPLIGSSAGLVMPSISVSNYACGGKTSRIWSERPLRKYEWDLARFSSSGTKLQQFRKFLHQAKFSGSLCYIPENVAEAHEDVFCGIADGSKTTFVVPFWSYTGSIYVQVAGVPCDTNSPGYNIYSPMNWLSQYSALFEGGSAGDWKNTTSSSVSAVSEISAEGLYCLGLRPTTIGTAASVTTDSTQAVLAGYKYIFRASYRGTHTARLALHFYDVTDTLLTTTHVDTASASGSTWQDLSISETAPTNSTYVTITLKLLSPADTSLGYFDQISFAHGDNDTFYQPNRCPCVIEFTTAPAANSVITASCASAKRITRVRLAKSGYGWSYGAGGSTKGERLTAVEDIDYA